MPVHQLVFVFACLAAALLVRRFFGAMVLIPTVFLHLFLGIVLGAVAKSGLGSSAFPLLNDGATIKSVELVGWIGGLFLLALGPSDTEEGQTEQVSWAQIAKVSVIGFGGTFLCASILGYLTGVIQPHLIGAAAEVPTFAMAIGLACAVTALPVLVSLLHERGEDVTPLGRLAIRVAVLDDIWLWLVVIVVTGMVHPEVDPWHHLAKVVALVAVSRIALRPALAALYRRWPGMSQASCIVLGLGVIVTMAAVSESAGTHALFGAFLAGWNLPSAMARVLRATLLPVVQALLVPFFFITTGMKTDMSFNGTNFLVLAIMFTIIGVCLKMAFVSLAARFAGLRWEQAFCLGALLQCKGLMEIVVLGLMRDANIIGPEVFSALIVMALSCTVLTVPLHSLVKRFCRRDRGAERGPAAAVWRSDAA